ncbi:MAG: hypothetical protein HON90_01725, partial [Halobacteriovoraceae bacterium]|nr:hypothetical protein [Halobacteriovoraceae bacterium]
RLENYDGYNDKIEKMVIVLHEHITESKKHVNYQSAYTEYFKHIYPTRDTLAKASDYSWEKLTPKQIKKMVKKMKK